jgi:hypothetical protein
MTKSPVASLVWQLPSELHEAQAKVVQQLGYRHRFFYATERIPPGTEIILVQGPYGSLLPLTEQLFHYPPDQRPVLAYWFQQSMHWLQPEVVRQWCSRYFSELHQRYPDSPSALLAQAMPANLRSRGKRLGFLGDMFWLHEHDLLDLLILSSTVYAEYLAQYGISSILLPRGSHPSYGSDLRQERDIAAVWMGKIRTRRRREAIKWLRSELEKRGQVLQVYDGVENDFIFGQERTQILNRAKFVLNVFFSGPTDELSIRYFIAAANGAVILSEPSANVYNFIPGKHLIEKRVEEMPDSIMHYMENPDQWQAISDNVQQLIEQEVTLENSIACILARATMLLSQRNRIAMNMAGKPESLLQQRNRSLLHTPS